ncbi:hypothetical protein ASPCADRAFT_395107 [Aspergillus carbonarius ITEM 5010]|uniref:Tyrosinase copper-binding domain-containing protein n=1 Tax=Aspergillus carbonarius (strain ITEM 5010) TaxID=602072 RepID=A0A1R3RV41_ASPC5|nr:hypothetical protein ASPCADRAFT_395107 [Aspergillus carbonarius ITEM 5010]
MERPPRCRCSLRPSAWVVGILSVILLSLSLLAVIHDLATFVRPVEPASSCAIRREWRTLHATEKLEYIRAVQCLKQQPSRLGYAHTLYDDFPYVHIHTGNSSHHTVMFLAWHRYLVHLYEQALRDVCQYDGHAVYWDWSLDWSDLTASPVWDSEVGFGGNGNPNDPSPAIHGACVTSGPFAHLQVPFVEQFSYPHCLSRDFAQGDALTNYSAAIHPSVIHQLFLLEDELDFVLSIEDGPHLSIPRTVHGDFSTITAPADPVFFLHHTQLDRLWSMWQHAHPQSSAVPTDDLIEVGGLGPDILATDVMHTESGLLCYRY